MGCCRPPNHSKPSNAAGLQTMGCCRPPNHSKPSNAAGLLATTIHTVKMNRVEREKEDTLTYLGEPGEAAVMVVTPRGL